MSNFEGGVRSSSFVTGGYLPDRARGTRTKALMHIADVYTTLCRLAKINATDTEAASVGLPPVDGIDQWPVISGVVPPDQPGPRDEVHLDDSALIVGRYKVITGKQAMDGWTGPRYPNNTGPQPSYLPLGWVGDCGNGCLYDIFADPTEHNDLGRLQPELLRNMTTRLQVLNAGNFNPDRGTPDIVACEKARARGGYYGPFVD
eukprot:UC1_evm6s2133